MSSFDGSTRLWNASSGELIETFQHEHAVLDSTFSPDGKVVATNCLREEEDEDEQVHSVYSCHLWDIDGGYRGAFETRGKLINEIAFSPDGSVLAACALDDDMDAETGQLLADFKGHEPGPIIVRFSPDGTKLVSGAFDTTVRVWTMPQAIIPSP